MGRIKHKKLLNDLERLTIEALQFPGNAGKTMITLKLVTKNYGLSKADDGYEVKVSSGHVFFTLGDRGKGLECNFYPDYDEMGRIRERAGTNFGDMLRGVKPLMVSDFRGRGERGKTIYRTSSLEGDA